MFGLRTVIKFDILRVKVSRVVLLLKSMDHGNDVISLTVLLGASICLNRF